MDTRKKKSAEKQQFNAFEQGEEYMNHDDTETDQSAGVGNAVTGDSVDGFQHRISVGIAQKHEVFIKSAVNGINDCCQNNDFQYGKPDARIGQRDFLCGKAGNDICDDQSMVEKLMN